MNECLTTPHHEKQIGYWVSGQGCLEIVLERIAVQFELKIARIFMQELFGKRITVSLTGVLWTRLVPLMKRIRQ